MKPEDESKREEVKKTTEVSTTILIWIPRVLLIVLLISFLYYLGYKLYLPELRRTLSVENVLYVIEKIVEFLYSSVNIMMPHIIALIVMCVFMWAVFDWKWILGYLATMFIVPICLANLPILASWFFSMGVEVPVVGYVISDIIFFGFRKMLELNYNFYKIVEEWIGEQPQIFLILLVSMSSLGLLIMYIDKRLAESSSRRIPEKDIVRYALLGGGLGIIFGAFLFEHKTRHIWLLTKILIVTFSTLYVLFMGWSGHV
ncbi:MAG: DUF1294 domain-containing protein [Nitrososphaerota archaeon]